jgi:hypothetical protein
VADVPPVEGIVEDSEASPPRDADDDA